MHQENFGLACDRLSQLVDGSAFERLRWARTEAPMLARLVALAEAAIGRREDFELAEEGSVASIKRFVVKVHGMRIFAICLGLDGMRAKVWSERIDRSRYTVVEAAPLTEEFATVDQPWMERAFEQLFGRIQS